MSQNTNIPCKNVISKVSFYYLHHFDTVLLFINNFLIMLPLYLLEFLKCDYSLVLFQHFYDLPSLKLHLEALQHTQIMLRMYVLNHEILSPFPIVFLFSKSLILYINNVEETYVSFNVALILLLVIPNFCCIFIIFSITSIAFDLNGIVRILSENVVTITLFFIHTI